MILSLSKYTVKMIIKFNKLYIKVNNKDLLDYFMQTYQLLSETPRIKGLLNTPKYPKFHAKLKLNIAALLWTYPTLR